MRKVRPLPKWRARQKDAEHALEKGEIERANILESAAQRAFKIEHEETFNRIIHEEYPDLRFRKL